MEPLTELCDLIAQTPTQFPDKIQWLLNRCPNTNQPITRSHLNSILITSRFVSKCGYYNSTDPKPLTLVLDYVKSIAVTFAVSYWPKSFSLGAISDFYREFFGYVVEICEVSEVFRNEVGRCIGEVVMSAVLGECGDVAVVRCFLSAVGEFFPKVDVDGSEKVVEVLLSGVEGGLRIGSGFSPSNSAQSSPISGGGTSGGNGIVEEMNSRVGGGGGDKRGVSYFEEELIENLEKQEIAFKLIGHIVERAKIDPVLLERVHVITKDQLKSISSFLKIRKRDWTEQGSSLKARINTKLSVYKAAVNLKIKSLASLDSDGKSSKKLLHGALALLVEAAEACVYSVWRLKREAKWGHLKDLHRAIKLCEPVLVSGDPSVILLGHYQKAYVYKNTTGGCAAFLANDDKSAFAKVNFQDQHYNLPPWSVSILPDCKNTVFNTARVGAQTTVMEMTREPTGFAWQSYNDVTEYYDDNTFGTVGLLEQLNVTRDASDYLWYMTDVKIDANERFLVSGEQPTLTALSAGHALHVFINGQLSGTVYGSLENPKITFNGVVNLRAGLNKISLLSIAVGLPNIGPHFETWNAGVLGPVMLSGLNEGRRDLSWQKWSYKVGLKGEILSLHSLSGSSSVEWVQGSYVAQKQPLTWYKATFDAPSGDEPLALDMNNMGKGQVWVNGQSIGRYWPAYKAKGNCSTCSYAGYYDEKKCLSNCGEASQRWYHVPRSWLNPRGNLLVVFEELGGIPYGISLVKRGVYSVCADIYEWQPSLLNYQAQVSGKATKPLRPKAHLSCGPGRNISSIKFASYGTPEGGCGSFQQGHCHAKNSYDVFNKICVGQESCAVGVSPEVFKGDPCPSVMKKLSVEVICS